MPVLYGTSVNSQICFHVYSLFSSRFSIFIFIIFVQKLISLYIIIYILYI
nr:MAG TPA_asm: hypothetical protein [Caudoviricetes sp.]